MATRDDNRETKGSSEPDLDDLARQMEALRADLAAIAETLKALGVATGQSAADGARDKARQARAAGEAQAEALRRSVEAILDETDTAARQSPLTAMGIAAALGFVIGLLLARR